MQKKIINEVIIGSNNKGKIKEIRDLLPKHYKIFSPKDFKLKSPKEYGKSFIQNSLIKAKYFSKKSRKVCIADDSGLEVDILNKLPGIFSSRWGGRNNDFNLAISKVYREINKKDKDWKNKEISARFICVLTVYGFKKKITSSIGIIEGKISKIKKGSNGFGYDPIFIPKGKRLTFAEMKPKTKHKIDHRFLAYKKIKKFF